MCYLTTQISSVERKTLLSSFLSFSMIGRPTLGLRLKDLGSFFPGHSVMSLSMEDISGANDLFPFKGTVCNPGKVCKDT